MTWIDEDNDRTEEKMPDLAGCRSDLKNAEKLLALHEFQRALKLADIILNGNDLSNSPGLASVHGASVRTIDARALLSEVRAFKKRAENIKRANDYLLEFAGPSETLERIQPARLEAMLDKLTPADVSILIASIREPFFKALAGSVSRWERSGEIDIAMTAQRLDMLDVADALKNCLAIRKGKPFSQADIDATSFEKEIMERANLIGKLDVAYALFSLCSLESHADLGDSRTPGEIVEALIAVYSGRRVPTVQMLIQKRYPGKEQAVLKVVKQTIADILRDGSPDLTGRMLAQAKALKGFLEESLNSPPQKDIRPAPPSKPFLVEPPSRPPKVQPIRETPKPEIGKGKDEDGHIVGEGVTKADKDEIKAKIRDGYPEVIGLNTTALWATVAVCNNLLIHRKKQLEELLQTYGVEDPQDIRKVLSILSNPLAHFRFFTTEKLFKPGRSDWYYLGDSQSLAVEVIYYLMQQEREGAGDNLLEEYILHEVLENIHALGDNAKQRHSNIILLTQELFARVPIDRVPGRPWRGQTVLGSLLRKFIDLQITGKATSEIPVEPTAPRSLFWNFKRWLIDAPDALDLNVMDTWKLLLGLTPEKLSPKDQIAHISKLLIDNPDLALSIDLMIAKFVPDPDSRKERDQAAKVALEHPILQERPDVWIDAAVERARAYKSQDYLKHLLRNVGVFITYLTTVKRQLLKTPSNPSRRSA